MIIVMTLFFLFLFPLFVSFLLALAALVWMCIWAVICTGILVLLSTEIIAATDVRTKPFPSPSPLPYHSFSSRMLPDIADRAAGSSQAVGFGRRPSVAGLGHFGLRGETSLGRRSRENLILGPSPRPGSFSSGNQCDN